MVCEGFIKTLVVDKRLNDEPDRSFYINCEHHYRVSKLVSTKSINRRVISALTKSRLS